MICLTKKRTVGGIAYLLSFLLVAAAVTAVMTHVVQDSTIVWVAGLIHALHIAAYNGLDFTANKEGVSLGNDNNNT